MNVYAYNQTFRAEFLKLNVTWMIVLQIWYIIIIIVVVINILF
jgi:hypothetical protein